MCLRNGYTLCETCHSDTRPFQTRSNEHEGPHGFLRIPRFGHGTRALWLSIAHEITNRRSRAGLESEGDH